MTMENLLTELTEIYANISLGCQALFLQLPKSWNLFLGNAIHSPSENQMEWIFKGKFLNNFTVSDWWLVHSHHCNKYTYVENL